jgi:glycerophosphoryl diester phosphodiesterase
MIDFDLLSACHGSGMRVITWTVNDPVEVRRLVAMEVDGIISDIPEIVPRE